MLNIRASLFVVENNPDYSAKLLLQGQEEQVFKNLLLIYCLYY